MVNTNDYIYRFLNRDLEGKRKHSEVINKILAGYIDADGHIRIKDNGRFYQLSVSLSQSAVNDPDFDIMRSFKRFYNIGSILFRFSQNPQESSRCDWNLGTKDSVKLFGLIGKHLIVKGKEFENIVNLYKEYSSVEVSEETTEFLRKKVCEFRNTCGPIKKKKHPSWAWLSGYIAGDGHLCCRLGRKRKKFDKKVNKHYNMVYNELYVVITGNKREVFDFLKEHFKGSVYDKGSYFQWKRSLGKGHKDFSENFLVSIKPYMLHPKKYRNIQRMLKHLRACRD